MPAPAGGVYFDLSLCKVSYCVESDRSSFHQEYRIFSGKRFVLVATKNILITFL